MAKADLADLLHWVADLETLRVVGRANLHVAADSHLPAKADLLKVADLDNLLKLAKAGRVGLLKAVDLGNAKVDLTRQ